MICELDFENNENLIKISDFLNNHLEADYMQGIQWNIIRNENRKYYLYYVQKDEIIWVCSLFEKNRNNEKILYLPRGPILDFNNHMAVNLFFSEIREWMLKNKYKKLIMNPYITSNQLKMFPAWLSFSITSRTDYKNLLESCKLAIMDIIFDEQELINKLPSKFRQNTRRSYRKSLICKIPTSIDITNFYKLYLETSIRHNFIPHDINYFKKITDVYSDKIVYFEVWKDDIPLAMSIDILYNNKLIYLYGVSSTENRNLLGMYNLQWETIKYCINHNIPKYDFGGVFCDENDFDNKDYGLYCFKKGYCYKGFIDIMPDIVIDFSKGVN